jgi:hypothetical protein
VRERRAQVLTFSTESYGFHPMDNFPEQRPPLDIEAAIDLVLAATAHRSQNASHSAFGKMQWFPGF